MPVRKNRKKNKKVKILSLSIGVLTILAITIYINFFSKSPEIDVVFHGAKIENMDYSNSIISARLRDGMGKILMTEDGFLISEYKVEWIEGKVNTAYSDYILFSDQIKLLSFYIKINERKSFNKLYENINNKFRDERGLYAEKYFIKSGDIVPSDEILVAEQIMFARSLIEGYSVFRNTEYLDTAKSISDAVLPLCIEDNIVPSSINIELPPPSPSPDFSATPTPKPEITPAIPIEDIRYLSVTDLSRIDLYGLSLLAQIDSGWKDIFLNTFEIMKNSYLDGDFSYFRPAFDINSNAYIPYKGDNPLFITTEQLKIMISLAEAGEINYPAYSYIKQHILNTKTLYATYQIPSGTPGTDIQSIDGYALMAKLARITQDAQVYEICIEKLFWNTATSTSSPIFGMIFQNEGESIATTNAYQVIEALISIY